MADLSYNTWNELPSIKMSEQLFRRQVTGDKLMSVQLNLDKGGIVPLHQHPHEQITHVISGVFEFSAEGETHRLEAGDVVVVPGDVPHSGVALEETVLIEVFSPPREDLLGNG